MVKKITILCMPLLMNFCLWGQTPAESPVAGSGEIGLSIPQKFFSVIAAKSDRLNRRISLTAEKSLRRFKKLETRAIRKLKNADSASAAVLNAGEDSYAHLEKHLKNISGPAPYIPGMDSLNTAINFLREHPGLIKSTKKWKEELEKVSGKPGITSEQLRKAEEIKKFIRQRKDRLRAALEKSALSGKIKKLNKQFYYYSRQLSEFKSILNDPGKLERKVLDLLGKSKLFRDFFRRNSQLARLFRMPGDPADPVYLASLQGLQTRAQVTELIRRQAAAGGAGGAAQLRQNLQAAQTELSQLKNKIIGAGGHSSDAELPEGFKPNNQKTKTFLQRLELGANIQSQKARSFFPVTSDIGLSLGYKLSDRGVIGIGASYQLGWGRGWNHLRLSSEGAGLRSYIDWKIRGSFWVSGGFEMNYKTAFSRFDQLKNYQAWQRSGLIGISKRLPLNNKFFKKTKIQLLWDFLSYGQVPKSQPVIFRIGYNFN